MEMIIENGCMLGMLGFLAVEDIRKRKIPVEPVVACGIAGVIIRWFFSEIALVNMVGGVAVGVCMLLFSKVSRGKIGGGDGILLMATGVFMGFWDNLLLLWLASLLAGMCGIAYCIRVKRFKDVRLPFVPFVLAAFVVILLGREGVLS